MHPRNHPSASASASASAVTLLLLAGLPLACQSTRPVSAPTPGAPTLDAAATTSPAPATPWDPQGPLAPGETYLLGAEGRRRTSIAEAVKQGLLDVDLSDAWAPFIFSESDGAGPPKPNPYRSTFVRLANDLASAEEILMETPQGELAALSAAGISLEKGAAETAEGRRAIAEARRAVRVQRARNYLEAYGIPPTLSVLLTRLDEDRTKPCFAQVDLAGLAAFDGNVTFQSREQAKKEYQEALADAAWVEKLLASERSGADATTGKIQVRPPDPTTGTDDGRLALLADLVKGDKAQAKRLERYRRGQDRLRAIRAVQARLVCEGLLVPRVRHTQGIFDLPTHEALAAWERKNDIFGWGFLGGETLAALRRPIMELHFDTFRRIVMERVADAAAILEDGSISGEQGGTFKDEHGVEHPVRNLIGEHADALLAALGIRTSEDVVAFLRRVGRDGLATLHVAFQAPPLPPYYGKTMKLSVQIDRGDVWYDLPFDDAGKPVVQERRTFPSLTVFTEWHGQKIALARWRTTIGSWRSEVGKDGSVYYKYKNSDVGPRVWKHVVAAPVWIPPDGTPGKELLTRKTLDRDVGAVTVVNTDVMGPGFQSAYGLVMAIHQRAGGGDNGIRTHGSVDYTSIARRYSHGCHRVVNTRAVRLFDFVLRRRPFERLGNQAMMVRKRFLHEDKEYEYAIDTRGYYYQLEPPIPVLVTEGRILGKAKRPIDAFVPKPGESPKPGEPDEVGSVAEANPANPGGK